MTKRIIIVLALFLIVVFYIVITYNNLVKKDEVVKLSWNEMQNNYQRRNDLIPGLVAVVQGSANFEKQIFEEIATKRAEAASLLSKQITFSNYSSQEKSQGELATTMNRLIALVEDYPDLKSAKAFTGLQTQLEGTERRIKTARKDFNESVNSYNQKVRQFPSNIVASLFGFKVINGFKADIGTDISPVIQFNQNK